MKPPKSSYGDGSIEGSPCSPIGHKNTQQENIYTLDISRPKPAGLENLRRRWVFSRPRVPTTWIAGSTVDPGPGRRPARPVRTPFPGTAVRRPADAVGKGRIYASRCIHKHVGGGIGKVFLVCANKPLSTVVSLRSCTWGLVLIKPFLVD